MPNYKITFPPRNYPPTAPYTGLSLHFKNLVKDGLMYQGIIKALLYPTFYAKVNTKNVRMRRQQRTQSVPVRRRRSICSSSEVTQLDSDTAASSMASSIEFIQIIPGKGASSGSTGTFVDHGACDAADCTREIFACYNSLEDKSYEKVAITRDSDGSFVFAHDDPSKCDIGARDSLKYYSKPVRVVIDRKQSGRAESLVHTTTAELVIGKRRDDLSMGPTSTSKGSPDDLSEQSSMFDRRINIACEDLVNIDGSMEIKIQKNPQKLDSHIDERHSMPNLLVGNRFNCSSLTEVFIPSYQSEREKSLSRKETDECRNSGASNTTTHSSSLDIPALVPAPDQLSTELLYNAEELPPLPTDLELKKKKISTASRESERSSHGCVIKPPSMFGASRSTSREIPLSEAPACVGDRNSGKRLTKDGGRRVSYQYVNLQDNNRSDKDAQPPKDTGASPKLDTRKCGCCVSSPCHSVRSSDSGMAGSCTISSPEAPILNIESEYQQLNEDFLNAESFPRLHSLMHSQSSHNFGRFNEANFHDSGQYGHCNYDVESSGEGTSATTRESAIRNMFELSMSQDTVRRQSRCQSAERAPESPTDVAPSPEKKTLYKTGLYAHWWKKQQLPNEILRDICRLRDARRQESAPNSAADRANRSPSSWGSGKQPHFSYCLCSLEKRNHSLYKHTL